MRVHVKFPATSAADDLLVKITAGDKIKCLIWALLERTVGQANLCLVYNFGIYNFFFVFFFFGKIVFVFS